MVVQAGPGKIGDSVFKMTRGKRAGVMAQVVDCLPLEHEVLNSNASTAKKSE
jgi:hypothetical protein